MKSTDWLLIVLAGAVACGSSDTGTTSDQVSVGDDDDDEDDDGDDDDDDDEDKPKDAGTPARDSGGSSVGRDAGRPVMSMGGGTDEELCYSQPVSVSPNSPDVLIVLDRSGSMVQGVDRWGPSVRAVKGLTSELTETVAFGLMVFPALSPMQGPPGFDWTIFLDPATYDPNTLADPNTYIMLSCDPGEVDVAVDLNTADEIASFLDTAAPDIGATPTSATLAAALSELDQSCGDCPSREKFVVLVTDGAPTCGTGGVNSSPEDIAATSAAIDALLAASIKTYVVGFATSSDPIAAAAMDEFAQRGGTEHHYAVEDEATLIAELTRIAGALVPCEFELKDAVEDPTLLNFTIDGKAYAQGVDWTYDPASNKVILNTEGTACPILRNAKVHKVNITQECEPPMIL